MSATRRLGDLELFPVGMGAMTLTQVDSVDEARATRAVHAALDAGIRLFDTADVYGPIGFYGINELALAKALRSWSGSLDDVVVATKGGHTRDGLTWWIDGSAEHLAAACRASIWRLGVESISLYQHHRPDPRRRYAESMLALRTLHDEGLVQRVGLSNADIQQIGVAVEILGTAMVRCRTSGRPWAVAPGRRSSCVSSSAWPSSPAAPSAACGVRRSSATAPRPSPTWRRSAASARSGWRWPGPSRPRRACCPSPGRAGRSRCSTVQAVDLVLSVEEMARLDAPSPGL